MYGFVVIITLIVSVSCIWGQNGNFGIRSEQTVSQNFEQFHPWEPSYKPNMDYTSHLLNNHYNQLVQQGIPPYQPRLSDQNQYGPGLSDQNQYGPGLSDQNQYRPGLSDQNQYGPGLSYQNQYGPGLSDQNQYGPGFSDQRLQHPEMQQHTQQITIITPPTHAQTFYNSPNGGFGFSGSGFDAPGIRFGVRHPSFYRPNISPMFIPYEKPTFMDKVGQFVKSDVGKAIGAMAAGTLFVKAVSN